MHIGLAADTVAMYAVAVDETGAILWNGQCPLASHRQGLVQSISALLAEGEAVCDRDCSVGLALPPPQLALSDNPMTSWLGTPLFAHQLRNALSRSLSVAGHLACQMLGDTLQHAPDSSFALELGKECDTLTTFGKILTNVAYRSSKQWQHHPLPGYAIARDGAPQPCECGGENCIARFLSVDGFEQRFWENYGIKLTAAEILVQAEAGESRAQYHLTHFHGALVRVLTWVCDTLAPSRILLSGELVEALSLGQITAELRRREGRLLNVEVARLDNRPQSAAIGAAWLPVARPAHQQGDPRPEFEVQLNQLPYQL